MWAQLITARLKAGKEADLPVLFEQIQAAEQPGSGLVRAIAMQDQTDPSKVVMLVVFESEEQARAREQDEQRQEALVDARATMTAMFDGPQEFVDLNVINDFQP